MTKSNKDKDVQFIEALAVLLREHDLNEVEVNREFGQNESLTVRVARDSQVVAPPPVSNPALAAPIQESVPISGSIQSAEINIDDPANHPGAVTSPMVGTVYMQPEPGAPPVVILTPATLPLIRFSAVTILPFVISFAVIASTEPVASFTVVVP